MSTDNERIVELSKNKITLMIIGSLVFVILGIWLATLDATGTQNLGRFITLNRNSVFVHGVGIVGIIFFSGCGVVGIVKFFDKKPGLVFSSAGVVDNASGLAAGFIPWSEITGISAYQISGQKLLIVKVHDPIKYINRGGLLKRTTSRANNNMCGSPIAISANTLKISFDELLGLFNSYMSKSTNT